MVFCMKKKNSNCLFFERRCDISVVICSFLIMFLVSVFIFLCIFYKFNFSISYSGFVVKEDDYYVFIIVDDNGIQRLQDSLLVFDKNRVDYSIIRISDEYVLSENGPMRYVYFKFSFDDKYKIVNNVLKLNFTRKCTILSRLKEMLK